MSGENKTGVQKTAGTIIKALNQQIPESLALPWDNVGLLVGSDNKKVSKIFIALDATDDAIEEAIAEGADMLLTHHPMIFSAMKRVNNADFIGRRILKMIQSDLSYYAMHTNYDVARMGQIAADAMGLQVEEVLDVTADVEGQDMGIGTISYLEPLLKETKKDAMSLQELCEEVKRRLGLPNVKVFGDLEQQYTASAKIAISPGSGKSEIKNALAKGAKVLITGDIDHHEGIDSVAQGMAIIDAGHYGIEHLFIEDMKHFCEKEFSDIIIKTKKIEHPFEVL